jgi:hypothetical protein
VTSTPPLDPELRRLGTLLCHLDKARLSIDQQREVIAALLIARLDKLEQAMAVHS